MDRKEMEDKVIESYQNDEKMMILIYAQWCINNDLEPKSLYIQAYPSQIKNNALEEALELTVSKKESGISSDSFLELTVSKKESEEIPDSTVLNVLQLFGNDDLAFIVQEQIDKRN